MNTSAVTVDKTVDCVTIIILQQLFASQLCTESTASKVNDVELKGILHQKSKFLNTVACCFVVTRCSKQSKEFIVTQNRGTQAAVRGEGGARLLCSDGTGRGCSVSKALSLKAKLL